MKQTVTYITLASLTLALALSSAGLAEGKEDGKSRPGSRTFRLNYGATLQQLPVGARVRVWLPVPQSSDHQKIKALDSELPGRASTAIEPTYGNKILYFDAKAPTSGSVSFRTSYLVRRMEVRGLSGDARLTELTEAEHKLFLSANSKVPLRGKQLSLINGLSLPDDPLAIARTLYDRVDDHVRYDKSRPGYGNGDVRWVCDSRFGNCTDCHSLFISLARAKGLPARFEIGFPLPPERGKGAIGGYHCWAMFHDQDKGWVPVDISEADKHPQLKHYYFGNLTEDRVTFSTGRDIDLVPQQDGAPLNFFVYPYVEVNGQVWPKENVKLSFDFCDVNGASST